MKKILFLALIGFGAWNYFGKQAPSSFEKAPASAGADGLARMALSAPVSQSFKCDGRVYCSEMTSKAEAEYFTKHCPGTKMDGDHDGIPCENDSRF
jgi:hypothetical protein